MSRVTDPCVDRHGTPIRAGDRVIVECTVVAVRDADCCVHLQVRAHERRAVSLTIDYFSAYSHQVERRPDPITRTDRWA